MKTPKVLCILALMLIPVPGINAQELQWPEISRETRPWTRWWWPGNIVTPEGLTEAMEKYSEAGLGGLEITSVYGVKGQEDKFINYLSPEWMGVFTHTLKEAERLGMGIDLANASGWPFGGPWVDPEDACKYVSSKIFTLTGGQRLTEKIEMIQQPLLRTVDQKPDISELTDPVATNENLQLYAIDQIRFEKALPLYSLIACSGSGEILDLYDRVTPENELDWTAPEGEWTIYALFTGWHGKLTERAGPGGEGDVIDHFSGRAVDNFLHHFDTVFKDYDISSLRGYFNDSYEVDDAQGQADWTSELFYEFFIRRGYNLGANLAALFQKDDPEKNARVLSDYRQTIADLILEKFTTHWTQWANRQGKTTRNQAHGSPGNILDLYAASDIPEAEGGEITRFKFASSASNVTGKRLTSCEAATWLDEHFRSGLADVKKAADLFFLGGINHLFYHGTCFSPPDEPWPGFLFYAAAEFTPANPFWSDFRELNNYITRVQSFLQQGMSYNNILLYFPVSDSYADYKGQMLAHFDGTGNAFEGTHFKAAAEMMIEKGYGFDYISDLQIKNSEFYEEDIYTEGNSYKTLILPACKYIPIDTFLRILKLANDGAAIIVYGDLPENVAGWAKLEEKTALFNQFKEGIHFSATNNPGVMKATYGQGAVIMGNNLNELLIFSGIRRELMTDNNLKFVRRETPEGYNYFIVNENEKAFDGWLPLSVKASSAAIFNPLTGGYGITNLRAGNDGGTDVYARINPGESMIISAFHSSVSGKQYLFYNPVADPTEIRGNWRVDFLEGGPTLPEAKEISSLISWTYFGGEEVKDFSGTARYTITFSKPSGKADVWRLNLGRVAESASVILNGEELAVLTGPDFAIDIDKKLMKKQNTLEIKVSNLMANRIAYMDRNNIEWKKFYNINMAARYSENTKNGVFDASEWLPAQSGLIGPVTLTPMEEVEGENGERSNKVSQRGNR